MNIKGFDPDEKQPFLQRVGEMMLFSIFFGLFLVALYNVLPIFAQACGKAWTRGAIEARQEAK